MEGEQPAALGNEIEQARRALEKLEDLNRHRPARVAPHSMPSASASSARRRHESSAV
jgi:hypothetical protein